MIFDKYDGSVDLFEYFNANNITYVKDFYIKIKIHGRITCSYKSANDET